MVITYIHTRYIQNAHKSCNITLEIFKVVLDPPPNFNYYLLINCKYCNNNYIYFEINL